MSKTALFTRGKDRLEVRAGEGEQLPTIAGYGAVFYREGDPGTEYQLCDDMVERIMPGAFDDAIKEGDVRSLFNHDPNYVLGRTAAGTLRLSVDATGLRYEVDPPAARADVVDSLQRGDVDGSSFMFEIVEVTWRETDKMLIREINKVRLWEVGPVVFPAYESATSGLRTQYRDRLKRESPPRQMEVRRRQVSAQARLIEIRERERNRRP